MRQSMLRKMLHVPVASNTKKICLLIGPNDVVYYDIMQFPIFYRTKRHFDI